MLLQYQFKGGGMYLKNAPFVVVECKTSFENDCRMVVLDIEDDMGGRLQVRVPEHLMASVAGRFMRERLFGLH